MNDLSVQTNLAPSAQADVAPAQVFDFRQVIAKIRGYRISIIAILLVMVVLGIVYTFLQTPLYTASASVQINNAAQQVLGKDESDTQSQDDTWDTDRFLTTQLDILQSRSLAERVADNLRLYGNARFLTAMQAPAGGDQANQRLIRETTINLLRRNMTVTLPRQSRVATIAFVSADPQVSAEVANAYADEFIKANLQRRYDSSAYARDFVAKQLVGAKQRLEDSERNLNAYARTAGLIRTRGAAQTGEGTASQGDGSVTVASLGQTNTAANTARAARIGAESRWKAVAAAPLLSSKEVLDNPSIQQLLTKRAEVEAEYNQERAKHLDEFPTVKQLRAQLNSINGQITTIATSIRNSVQEEYRAALAAEQSLQSQVAALTGDTLGEQDRTVRYNILAREADTNRTLYDGLLQRYKDLTAQAGISSSNILLIDPADPPLGPSSPNLFKNLMYALFAGILLAAAMVFIRMQLDDVIRVPEDAEEKLGLPVLGVIPRPSDSVATDLQDPKSQMSEAYNSLRSAIGFSMPENAPPVLLVTSATAAEGKSTTAISIARGFARLGARTLLVDVDLRRPSVHRLVDALNEKGLSSVLTAKDKLADAIIHDEASGIDVLPAGPLPTSPSELFSSGRFTLLLEELVSQYDKIILDSPPVLGLADAPTISTMAGAVLFVIEANNSRAGIIRGSLRRLLLARARLLGVALTKFDPSRGYGYSYYHTYDYYNYESAKRDRKPFWARRESPAAGDA